ncbi:hypothetical protein KBB27_00685 [Patescibacteria group bacterium]|nr:hypothetical protein [Patescibacteria group bacterium]
MEEIIFLLATIVIESATALFMMRKIPIRRILFVVLCVNLITHPIAWFFRSSGVSWLSVEIVVTSVEMLFLSVLFSEIRFRAALTACAMNGVSAFTGWLL